MAKYKVTRNFLIDRPGLYKEFDEGQVVEMAAAEADEINNKSKQDFPERDVLLVAVDEKKTAKESQKVSE